MKDIRVTDGIAFPCPFCGGRVEAGTLSSGEMGVLHDEPACTTFIALDPPDFLREARLKMTPS